MLENRRYYTSQQDTPALNEKHRSNEAEVGNFSARPRSKRPLLNILFQTFATEQ